MTKPVRKRIIIPMILTICLAAFAALFMACNNTPPATGDDVTYTVTVCTDQGPASGVGVAVKKGSAAIGSVQTTGADGKVTLTLPSDEYTVELSKLPDHYELPENANVKLTASNPNLTITLAQKFAYVVNLVTADNKPFYAENVQVGICTLDGNCRTPVALESGGVARIEDPKGNYHTQVLGLDGYVYECDEKGYYSGKNFSATDTEMTITVYPAVELAKGAPLTDAQKTASAYAGFYEIHDGCPAYEYEVPLTVGSVAYYKLTPEISGKYYLHAGTSSITCYNDGRSFSLDVEASNAINGLQSSYYAVLEAEETYYFKTKVDPDPEDDKTILAVVAPNASYVELGNLAGEASPILTVNSADAVAVIAVKPASGAAYKATAQDETLVKLDCVKSEPASTAIPTPDGYEKGAKAAAKLTSRYAGQYTLYFTVQVKADKYPATAKIKVEKTATLTDETTVVKVKETLTKQTAPENKELAPLPMTADPVKGNDGYYHVGDKNGATVVVNITKPSRLSKALAYADVITGRIDYSANYVSVQEVEELAKGDKYTDYREFIRGFKEYADSEYNIPALTEQNCYANNVDENGCYPLNQELYDFLKVFYELNENILSSEITDGEPEYKHLFPCYYYADAVEADPIVGTYEKDDNGSVYRLTVDKFGTFKLDECTMMGDNTLAAGEWTVDDNGTYAFTFSAEYEQYNPSMAYNKETKTFTYSENNEPLHILTPYIDPVIGQYQQTDIALTINDDGTFVFTENGHNTNGSWVKTAENAYTFTEHNATFGDIPYTVTRNAQNGQLVFMDGENEAYVFDVVGGDSEPTDIYQNKAAKLELYADDDTTGKFKFYMVDSDSGELVEFATGSYTMGKPIQLTFDDPSVLGGTQVSVAYNGEADTMTVTLTEPDSEPQTLILRHA